VGGRSKELESLRLGEKATRLADAAGDGVMNLEIGQDAGISIWDQLSHDPQAARSQTWLQLPAYKPSPRRRSVSQGARGQPSGQHRQRTSSGSHSDTSDSDTDSEADGDKNAPEELNKEVASALMQAAHTLLTDNPEGVLQRWLCNMLQHPKKALPLASYMLAMLENSKKYASGTRDLHSRADLAAFDIEKATVRKGVESWPGYAEHAAAGMRPVIPVLEFGGAWVTPTGEIEAAAVQVQETLDKEEEATTGWCGSERSKQYRDDNKAQAVNTKAYASCNNPDRLHQPSTERTAGLAMSQMRRLLLCTTFTHNTSMFDERACFKIMLVSRARANRIRQRRRHRHRHRHRHRQPLSVSPQQGVRQAALKLVESETLPAFFPGHKVLAHLFKVLWDMLREIPQHAPLLQRAQEAAMHHLPGHLEWAAQVLLLYNLYTTRD